MRRQGVCCGGKAGIEHFDISFFGFEELAHPLYGQQVGPRAVLLHVCCMCSCCVHRHVSAGRGVEGAQVCRPAAAALGVLCCRCAIRRPACFSRHAGVQMLQYRPVDCNTRQPVGPNYIDK